MRLYRVILPIALTTCVASFAASAQNKMSDAAKTATSLTASSPVQRINTDGLKALIAKQRDKPLLVNFWATWCDPCRDEFPDLVKIDAEFRPQSLDFVTVSLDETSDINTEVPKFLTKMKATMPAYLLDAADPEPAINAVDPKWQGDLPATFLYNEKGAVVYKHFGRVNTAELREAIKKLVGQKG
jgi:thiol-disulfide isomerase/thioredoxin